MLSVAKLTPGQEAYYERAVAAGLDDYYAGKGESPGIWAGAGAASLGLEGEVEKGELGSLVRGKHPQTGDELRAHVKARTITVERIDAESGKRWLEEKKLAPVAGFDLVFSTPKSVSLLHALGEEETRSAIAEAHRCAWQAALAYLEEEACVTRRGKDGFIRERGGGFVAAAYQHRTSRAQDPHLHTHVIVANMTQSPSDGEWRALDGEAILKTCRLAAGYLYEAHLRFELSTRLGLEWEKPEKGWAELEGVPRAVIDAFSTRRAQVVGHMGEQATSGFYAAQVAAVASRERKEELDLPRLREEWAARATEHGLDQKELEGLLDRSPYREPSPAGLVALAERMLGPEGLTEKRSAFSTPELVMAWAQAHAQGAAVERIRSLCARFLELPGVERVAETPAPGRAAYYSTAELLRIEREALALVERRHGADASAVPAADLDELLREPAGRPLSPSRSAWSARSRAATTAWSRLSGSRAPGRRRRRTSSRLPLPQPGSRCSGPLPPGLPPSVCRTRAASRQRHSTASSPGRDGQAGSRRAASSSSTRRGWRRRACLPRCSRSSRRRRGRRCSWATRASSPPSARAASSPPSSSATARFSCARTDASGTSSREARSRPSAAAWGASTSPSPSGTSASSSRRVHRRRGRGSWPTGGRRRRRTCREAS